MELIISWLECPSKDVVAIEFVIAHPELITGVGQFLAFPFLVFLIIARHLHQTCYYSSANWLLDITSYYSSESD